MSFNDYQVRARETSAPADEAVELLIREIMGAVSVTGDVPLEGVSLSWDAEVIDRLRTILRVSYSVLGLCSEAGEVAGKLKKVIRDNGCSFEAERLVGLSGELGDTQWYLSDTASSLGLLLGSVAQQNLATLRDRRERGVLQGDGDDR